MEYDFEDGNGLVAAHKHSNGGGWVADSASVAYSAYVGTNARVFGNAEVFENAEVFGSAQVSGKAQVCGNADVYGKAQVFGDAQVCGDADVYGDAKVFGDAVVSGYAWTSGEAYGSASAKMIPPKECLEVGPNSDGGPTSYYDFPDTWVTWNDLADYKSARQWKEHSFHLGNVGKAIFRWGEKEGTTKVYDAKKIIYSGVRILVMMIGVNKTRDYLTTLLNDEQFKKDLEGGV